MKCIVKDCANHEFQGGGVHIDFHFLEIDFPAWICIPCFQFLLSGKDKSNSQLMRNGAKVFSNMIELREEE